MDGVHFNHMSFQGNLSLVEKVFVHGAMTFWILGTILGNVLLIVVIVKRGAFRKPACRLLVSLASTDFLIGMIIIPIQYYFHFISTTPKGEIGGIIIRILDMTFCTVSYLTVAAIAWDRAYAISSPLTHRWKQTPRRITRVILGLWILAIAIVTSTQFGLRYLVTQTFQKCHEMFIMTCATVYAPSLVIVAANACVIVNLRKRKKRISETTSDPGYSQESYRYGTKDNIHIVDNSTNMYLNTAIAIPRINKKLRFDGDEKALATLAGITGVAFVCWLPVAVGYTLIEFNISFVDTMKFYGFWLLYANSTLNPILYFIVNKESRKDLYSVFSQLCNYKGCRQYN